MDIRITKSLWDGYGDIFEELFPSLVDVRWDYRDDVVQSIRPVKNEALLKLAEELESGPNIRGCKTMARDIKTWVAAVSDGGNIALVRARNVRQGFNLVVERLARLPNHHVYERRQEDEEGVLLPYYVDKVEFHEANRDHTPAHFDIRYVYFHFGQICATSKTYWAEDCQGLTADEILLGQGNLVETEVIRQGFQETLTRWAEVKNGVGDQYLARGLADDRGIDGNESERDDWWFSWKKTQVRLDKDGRPSKVVVDVFQETANKDSKSDAHVSTYFWATYKKRGRTEDYEDGDESLDEDQPRRPTIPVHPYVACFDLTKHKRLRIHIDNLSSYEYNTKILEKLVLPESHSRLIDTLLEDGSGQFSDVVAGKTGGIIVLCQGIPGTGKTLTAEIYAEALRKPLYTIQCSQLGVESKNLESNLMKVLARGRRWGAVVLLDEADVYVHQRGSNLIQNAIVGVFLRVLEYHTGVLFLTTNRGDLVDDAILSRCTARIPYDIPSVEDQRRIWLGLADSNNVALGVLQLDEIMDVHDNLSGRDIKNLLKLAMLVSRSTGRSIDADLITEMQMFKPTGQQRPG